MYYSVCALQLLPLKLFPPRRAKIETIKMSSLHPDHRHSHKSICKVVYKVHEDIKDYADGRFDMK